MKNKCCRNKRCCQEEEEKKGLTQYMKLGFAFWLTVVFVTLKLFGAINWSWLWVLSPLWIGFSLIITLMVVYVVLLAISRQTARIRIKITKNRKTSE
jgi:membrane protein YdbS with pleckstrin-like domain